MARYVERIQEKTTSPVSGHHYVEIGKGHLHQSCYYFTSGSTGFSGMRSLCSSLSSDFLYDQACISHAHVSSNFHSECLGRNRSTNTSEGGVILKFDIL